MSSNTVTIATEDALAIINQVLPFLEQALPAVEAASGPIGLGVSAATALVPLIGAAYEAIAAGSSVADQKALYARVQAIKDASTFAGPEWAISPLAKPPAP